MIILRKIKNETRREKINFEFIKNVNYNYKIVKRLIKVVYNKINKFDQFNSIYINLNVLSSKIYTNENLLRQVFINTNIVFSTIF